MAHNHHHNESNLKLAFFLNFGFAIAEIIGGYLFNSIAIMADALHDLGDSVSLALSWRLEKLSKKGGDEKYSYGYKRFSLLSALGGAFILIGGSIIIIAEAVRRLQNPQLPIPNARGMLVFAHNKTQDLYISEELVSGRIMAKDENVCLHCGMCAERCPTAAWDMLKFTYKSAVAGDK